MGYFLKALAAIIFILNSNIAFAQNKKSDFSVPKIKMIADRDMQKIREHGSIVEQHRLLRRLSGEWTVTIQYWDSPAADPQLSTGTAVNEMILEDRYLSSSWKTVLNIGGNLVPLQAQAFVGYDRFENVFTSLWMDTIGTSIIQGTGTLNEKGNVIEETGQYNDPVTGKMQKYRAELHFGSNENYRKLIFIKDDSGKEFQTLEIKFLRKS